MDLGYGTHEIVSRNIFIHSEYGCDISAYFS